MTTVARASLISLMIIASVNITGPTPGYRYQPVMVYDRERSKTLLQGGLDPVASDTWEWDGRQWRQVGR